MCQPQKHLLEIQLPNLLSHLDGEAGELLLSVLAFSYATYWKVMQYYYYYIVREATYIYFTNCCMLTALSQWSKVLAKSIALSPLSLLLHPLLLLLLLLLLVLLLPLPHLDLVLLRFAIGNGGHLNC